MKTSPTVSFNKYDKKLHISFFVDDLATNSIVRAALLAEALIKEGHRVEILGYLINGEQVYAPYCGRFSYKTVRVTGSLKGHLQQLANMAEGDVIYACKPLLTSFLPALLASGFGHNRPLLLDVDDNELWIDSSKVSSPLRKIQDHLYKYWQRRWLFLLHPLRQLATDISVVSHRLQKHYGGHIVLHGYNEHIFDPGNPALESNVCRKRFALPEDKPLILFAGYPQQHKGLELLIDALKDKRLQNLYLVLAGPPQHPIALQAMYTLSERVIHIGMVPNHEMPQLLSAVDIVPTPQTSNSFTESQIPAKLIEAMAMGKAVVASRVSDLPLILGEWESKPRGWLFDPGDTVGLADCIVDIIQRPDEAKQRGLSARDWFIQNASTAAIQERLRPLIDKCVDRIS